MIILEVLLGIKSKKGDITSAFLHADLGKYDKAFFEMPWLFEVNVKNGRTKVLIVQKLIWITSNPQSLLEVHDIQYGIMWHGKIQYGYLYLHWKESDGNYLR